MVLLVVTFMDLCSVTCSIPGAIHSLQHSKGRYDVSMPNDLTEKIYTRNVKADLTQHNLKLKLFRAQWTKNTVC